MNEAAQVFFNVSFSPPFLFLFSRKHAHDERGCRVGVLCLACSRPLPRPQYRPDRVAYFLDLSSSSEFEGNFFGVFHYHLEPRHGHGSDLALQPQPQRI